MATLTASITNYIFTEPPTSEDSVRIAILQLNDPKAEALATEESVRHGVAVQRYGVWMIPKPALDETFDIKAVKDSIIYSADIGQLENEVGSTITFTEEV